MRNAVRVEDSTELQSEAGQAIAEHGGDAEETVKALLVANAHLLLAIEPLVCSHAATDE